MAQKPSSGGKIPPLAQASAPTPPAPPAAPAEPAPILAAKSPPDDPSEGAGPFDIDPNEPSSPAGPPEASAPAAPPPEPPKVEAPPAKPVEPTGKNLVSAVRELAEHTGKTGVGLLALIGGPQLGAPPALQQAAYALAFGVNTGVGGREAERVVEAMAPSDLAELLEQAVERQLTTESAGAFLHERFPEPKPAPQPSEI